MTRTKSPLELNVWQFEAKTLLIPVRAEETELPVDLSGMTLRFVAHDSNLPAVGNFEVDDALITVSGQGNYIANVAVTPTETLTANSELHWKLWDVTTPTEEHVLAHGSLQILAAVKDV